MDLNEHQGKANTEYIHKRSGKGHAAGGLGGRLAQAQRGPERPREVERGQKKPVMRLAGDDQAGSPQISVWNPRGSPRGLPRVAEAQRRPEMPREAQRAGTWIEQACHAFGWRIPGWLAEAQRGPERPREAQRSPRSVVYVRRPDKKTLAINMSVCM